MTERVGFSSLQPPVTVNRPSRFRPRGAPGGRAPDCRWDPASIELKEQIVGEGWQRAAAARGRRGRAVAASRRSRGGRRRRSRRRSSRRLLGNGRRLGGGAGAVAVLLGDDDPFRRRRAAATVARRALVVHRRRRRCGGDRRRRRCRRGRLGRLGLLLRVAIVAQAVRAAPKDLASEEVSTHRKMIWVRNAAVIALVTLLSLSMLNQIYRH